MAINIKVKPQTFSCDTVQISFLQEQIRNNKTPTKKQRKQKKEIWRKAEQPQTEVEN